MEFCDSHCQSITKPCVKIADSTESLKKVQTCAQSFAHYKRCVLSKFRQMGFLRRLNLEITKESSSACVKN